ncbi:MAG: DUF4163 domain-containing protein [Deltaproteobacteria bacterium]|nr:DUF4163 domain-containing protein [Deltaproteobacteria bacterium]
MWPSCPKGRFDYDVSYPRGMDNGGPVDVAVTAVAQGYIASFKEEGDSWYTTLIRDCDPEFSAYVLTSTNRISASPYKASSGVYSVLFSKSGETGGAHGYFGFETVNFFSDGLPVSLRRLFPDPQRSLPRLWSAIFAGFCRDHGTAPHFYGNHPCGRGVPPLPDPLRNLSSGLDAAGHMLLTSLGLSVIMGPYEGYSFGEGAQYVDIPRDELLSMGASPAVWR